MKTKPSNLMAFALWSVFSCLSILFLSVSGAHAQSRAEIAFVTKFFDELQPKSIANNREYCGYFGVDENHNFVATRPIRGREGSCMPPNPPETMEVFASYHTHGAFSYEFDSELPSSDDLRADIAEETNGYIATPGGRIWFDDAKRERAVMICGRNCTVSDSDFDADGARTVHARYSLEQLYIREND